MTCHHLRLDERHARAAIRAASAELSAVEEEQVGDGDHGKGDEAEGAEGPGAGQVHEHGQDADGHRAGADEAEDGGRGERRERALRRVGVEEPGDEGDLW